MFILPEMKPNEVLIYLRKSRTDDPSLSVSETVAKHEQMLDDYCMTKWGELVPEQNRFREIVSGETIAARPEVRKLLRLIEQPRFKAVLIVEPQRLSRGDLEDIGRLTKLFRYTGTLIITLQGIFDLNDERDRDYFERELMRGNDYLEYSKRILRNGVRASVERGNYVGSVAPYGYAKVRKKDGNRKFFTLEIVPETAEIVRMIFRMYADGNGASSIANHLNRLGIAAPRGDHWQQYGVYHILDNYHYIGKIPWNARKTVLSIEDGEMKKSRPRAEPELFDGAHEPIISPELWEAVRAKRKARSIPKVRSSFDIQNPIAGLLYCECGYSMRQHVPRGKSRRAYCPNQPNCNNAGCTNEIIMEAVCAAIRSHIADIKSETETGGSVRQSGAEIKMLRQKLDALKKKNDALWEKYAEGMPKDTFTRLLEKNETEAAECAQMLDSAVSASQSAEIMHQAEWSLHEALRVAESGEASAKEVNSLLKTVIRRIVYKRKRAEKSAGGNRGGWIAYEPEISVEFLV